MSKHDYELGSKDSGFMFESLDGNTSLNLKRGDLTMKNTTYRDEKGNEISKEEFDELRIQKLETKVSDLEGNLSNVTQALSSLQNLKVNKDEVVSAINISQEGIRITGDKLNINESTLKDN